ncbi:MAG: hypothetical protein KGL39_29735 [Patescibacteria group bacterium]|nr:hypothetical protein [Patescibacteria group bacterium]
MLITKRLYFFVAVPLAFLIGSAIVLIWVAVHKGGIGQDSNIQEKIRREKAAAHDGEPRTEDEKLVAQWVEWQYKTRTFIRWGPNDTGLITSNIPGRRLIRVRFSSKTREMADAVSDLLVEIKKDGTVDGIAGFNTQGDRWLENEWKVKMEYEDFLKRGPGPER